MPTLKLNEKAIAKLQAPDPTGKQMLYWDSDLKGFGVLCSGVSNAKTYIVQHSLAAGLKRRVKIGACNVLKFAAAKDNAKSVLADFFKGIDPKGGRKEKATLRDALEDYLATKKKLAPASIKNYRYRTETYLKPCGPAPARDHARDGGAAASQYRSRKRQPHRQ